MIKICLIGPESTGKTTLAHDLGTHFNAPVIIEYAAEYMANLEHDLKFADLDIMLKQQLANEDKAAQQSPPLLICDSDALTTKLYSAALFSNVSPFVQTHAKDSAKRYTHTLLTSPDVPWVDDEHRISDEGRDNFFKECRYHMEIANRPYTIIEGDWDERLKKACETIQNLL